MAPKRGLGRGLSNLIPTDDTTEDVSPKASKQTKTGAVTKTEVVKKVEQTLNINRIEPNKNRMKLTSIRSSQMKISQEKNSMKMHCRSLQIPSNSLV